MRVENVTEENIRDLSAKDLGNMFIRVRQVHERYRRMLDTETFLKVDWSGLMAKEGIINSEMQHRRGGRLEGRGQNQYYTNMSGEIQAQETIGMRLNGDIVGKPGIYLVPPHGQLVSEGRARVIIKDTLFPSSIEQPLILCSGGLAYGVIRLHRPTQITMDEFEKSIETHMVSAEERVKRWPRARVLYSFPFELVERYDPPRAVNAVSYNGFIANVEFKKAEAWGLAKPAYRIFEIEDLKNTPGFDKGKIVVESKFDGVRILVIKKDGKVTLTTNPAETKTPNKTSRLPWQAAEIAKLPGDFRFDAELVMMGDGDALHRTAVNALINAKTDPKEASKRAHLYIFDVLEEDGESRRTWPLKERKETLAKYDDSEHIHFVRPTTNLGKKGLSYLVMAENLTDVKQAVDNLSPGNTANLSEGSMMKVLGAPYSGKTWCLSGKTHILTLRGLEPVNALKPGDYVICKDGKPHKIKRVFKRIIKPEEVLWDITPNHGVKVRVTGEHQILTADRSWIPASNLELQDKLFFPEPEWWHIGMAPLHLDLETQGYKKHIPCDAKFWKFIGFWVAEGSNNRKGRAIRLAVNPDCTNLDEYRKIISTHFGIEANYLDYENNSGNPLRILEFSDGPFWYWLAKHFREKRGTGGDYQPKTIPLWFFNLSNENWTAFLEGLWEGDGFHSDDRKGYRIATSSAYLAGMLYLVAWLRGETCYISSRRPKIGRTSFTLHFKGNVEPSAGQLKKVRVRRSKENYHVYDIEVEGEDSFLAPGITFHNCKLKTYYEIDALVTAKHTVSGQTDVYYYDLAVGPISQAWAEVIEKKKKSAMVWITGDKYYNRIGRSNNTKESVAVGKILRVASEDVNRFETDDPRYPYYGGYVNRVLQGVPSKSAPDGMQVVERLAELTPRRKLKKELSEMHRLMKYAHSDDSMLPLIAEVERIKNRLAELTPRRTVKKVWTEIMPDGMIAVDSFEEEGLPRWEFRGIPADVSPHMSTGHPIMEKADLPSEEQVRIVMDEFTNPVSDEDRKDIISRFGEAYGGTSHRDQDIIRVISRERKKFLDEFELEDVPGPTGDIRKKGAELDRIPKEQYNSIAKPGEPLPAKFYTDYHEGHAWAQTHIRGINPEEAELFKAKKISLAKLLEDHSIHIDLRMDLGKEKLIQWVITESSLREYLNYLKGGTRIIATGKPAVQQALAVVKPSAEEPQKVVKGEPGDKLILSGASAKALADIQIVPQSYIIAVDEVGSTSQKAAWMGLIWKGKVKSGVQRGDFHEYFLYPDSGIPVLNKQFFNGRFIFKCLPESPRWNTWKAVKDARPRDPVLHSDTGHYFPVKASEVTKFGRESYTYGKK